MSERAAELAAIVTEEHGKVLSDALGEVGRGLEVVEFACGIPYLLKGGYSEGVSAGVDVHSVRQPLGVVAVISPFNFPAMVPAGSSRSRSLVRERSHPQTEREGSIGRGLDRRALGRGGSAGGSLQRRPRGQGRSGPPARAPRRKGGLVRRFDSDRPLRLRDRNPGGQAGPGAGRGEEPYGRTPRRRFGPGC